MRAAGIGSAASALLPFIPVAAAQTQSIKRLVLLTSPNGTVINRWRSNGSGTPFTSGGVLPQIVGPVLAPLDRHRANVTLVDGLDFACASPNPINQAGHNGIACTWSGSSLVDAPPSGIEDPKYSNAATIDQILAQASTTRFPSLVLSTTPRGKQTYNPSEAISSYSGPSAPVTPSDDPQAVFDLLFASGVDGSATATAKRRASRLSILNSISGELSRLRKVLPANDRDRLDLHVAGVQNLDQRLAAMTVSWCTVPTRPGVTTEDDVLERLRLHVALVKAAFACDLTRVANIQQGSEGTSWIWCDGSELPSLTYDFDMHNTSHLTYIADTEAIRESAVDSMAILTNAMAEEFSKLLDTLDDGSGLLDQTLCCWGMAMGWGGAHLNWSVPFVLGSRLPNFKGGYYHRFGNYDLNLDTAATVPANPWSPPGIITPHNKLLVSMMHLMGRTDVTAVGDAAGQSIDNSPLTELMS